MTRKNTKREFWVGRNVLVTGATGFVGSWITEALVNRQANVTISVFLMKEILGGLDLNMLNQ